MSTSPYSEVVLKRSATHFLIGKVISASLTFTILLWLVRLLSIDEYGTYVTLVAGTEIALVVTSLGLPWVAARYIPEFRLHANGKQLTRYTWQIIIRICLFTVLGAILLFFAMPWLLRVMNLGQQTEVARLYLLVFVFEGLRRNLQECLLEPLMQQSQVQLSQVVRNLAILAFLGVVYFQEVIHLNHVVIAELMGTILGTISALNGMIVYLRGNQYLQGKDGWQPPDWAKMWHTAFHMYFSFLVTMTYSPQTFIFLTQRFLGVETTALFGFLLNLFGQITRYLPANLLFGVIRPKLIASFVCEGGMVQLTRNANLVGKISLFVLMPLLVFTWLAGEELTSVLSGGKFAHSGYFLGGLLLMLIPLSQRQILETVAVACGQSHFCFWGSSLGVLTLPLAYWLFELGNGLWSSILAMIAGQIIVNSTLITSLRITTDYRPDTAGLIKLMVAALLGFMLSILVTMAWVGSFQPSLNSLMGLLDNAQAIVSKLLVHQITLSENVWLNLAIIATVAFSIFLLISFVFKPFRTEERMRLNRMLHRNLFVW